MLSEIDQRIYDAWLLLFNSNRPALYQFLLKNPLKEQMFVFRFKRLGHNLPMPTEEDRINSDNALRLLKEIK